MADTIPITIEIKPRVSRDTAELCVKVLEIFLNENNKFFVDVKKHDDGTNSYSLIEE